MKVSLRVITFLVVLSMALTACGGAKTGSSNAKVD